MNPSNSKKYTHFSDKNNVLYWLVVLIGIWICHYLVRDYQESYFMSIAVYSGINIILAVSLNLVFGFTGQFSIGHAGFMAVGGYFSAFVSLWFGAKFPELLANEIFSNLFFVVNLVGGGVASLVMGYLVGLPTLRLRGDYLAIVTLGFGEIVRVLILNMDFIGGARGLPGIPSYTNFGIVYSVALIAVFVVSRTMRSAAGRSFLSVREDEVAAEAMGVNTTKAKVRAFMLGSFFAGVAGGLFAHYLRYLNPSTFDFNKSFEVIIMVVFGGMGSISGSVVAAIFLTALKEMLRPLQDLTQIDLRMIIYALILIIVMLTRPQGIFGEKEVSAFFSKRNRISKRS